jgi:cadmium resistance protein CadD (predicted permease)
VADFFAIVGLGIGGFLATNIDDLLILMVFFANRRFPSSQIVLGQYVGMGSLLAVSLIGLLIALAVPRNLVGLVGFFPTAIGIKELLELQRKDNDKENNEEQRKHGLLGKRIVAYLPFLTVAAVTFSGGEEIGIYASLFAVNNEVGEIITIISVSMGLTGLWCGLAHYLVNRRFVAVRFRRIAEKVLPFVLIGLGIYILAEAFLIPSLLLPS